MLRRSVLPNASLVQATMTVARRGYIDYQHLKYPRIPQITVGVPAILFVFWVFWLSCGSIWWQSNREWKGDPARGWRRMLGTGYKWSTEWGPAIESIYTNLPTRAE
jgi:hypothetical protein